MKKYIAYIVLLVPIFLVPIGIYSYYPDKLILWWAGLSFFALAFLLAWYRYEKILFLIMTISLPLSFSVSLGGGLQVDTPSEIIIALLATATVIKYVLFEKHLCARLTKLDPISVVITLYILWNIIALFFSEMTMVSIKAMLVQLSYILVFYTLFRDLLKRTNTSISVIYIYYGATLSLVLIYSFWNWIPYQFVSQAAILIAEPFFSDHTILSTALVFLLPFFIAYAYDKSKQYKVLLITVAVVLMVIILMLHARAAWLSILLSVALLAMFYFGLRIKQFYVLICMGLVVIYAFQEPLKNAVAVNHSDSSAKHASLVEETQSVVNINNDVSNLERINRWSCAWRMFLDRPMFGFGLGTYQFQYIDYQRSSEMTRISVTSPYHKHRQGTGGSAHSEYFLRLSETGLLAFILFVLLWFVALKTGLDCIDQKANTKEKIYIYAILFALTSYFIHSFFNNFLETGKIAFLFWTALALLSHKKYSLNTKH